MTHLRLLLESGKYFGKKIEKKSKKKENLQENKKDLNLIN